jgi:hypothetical protein
MFTIRDIAVAMASAEADILCLRDRLNNQLKMQRLPPANTQISHRDSVMGALRFAETLNGRCRLDRGAQVSAPNKPNRTICWGLGFGETPYVEYT